MRDFLQWLLALVLLVGSGIQVTHSTHEVRRLHAALQDAQRIQDEGLAEHSRLLLEARRTCCVSERGMRLAESRLQMQFPHRVERVEQ